MIERSLKLLAAHGVTDAVLSVGYRPDAFRAAYPDNVCGGVAVDYAVEPEPLDTAGGIAFAARWAGIDEPFLAVNVDVLSEVDVSALVDFHTDRRAEATIALTPVDDPSRFGVVPTDADGRVTEFIEKPEPGTAPTNNINAGFYVLDPRILDRIPAGRRVSVEREVFPAVVADGQLYALASDAYWIDTGNSPQAYLQSNLDALGDAPSTARWGGTVERSAVAASARVDAGARVSNAVILDDAVVARDAVVSRSIVGRRAVIGEGAVVDDFSVLGDGAIVPPGAVVRGERVSVVA